jgi:hypothetical protein
LDCFVGLRARKRAQRIAHVNPQRNIGHLWLTESTV